VRVRAREKGGQTREPKMLARGADEAKAADVAKTVDVDKAKAVDISEAKSGRLEQKRMARGTQKRRPERRASARQAHKFVGRSVESTQTEEENVGPQLPSFDEARRGGFCT